MSFERKGTQKIRTYPSSIRAKSKEINWILNPSIVSLKIVGIYPKRRETLFRRFSLRNGLVLIYLHLYSIHMTCNWLNQLDGTTSLFSIFDNLSNIIRSITTTFSADTLFYKIDSIYDCLRAIKDATTEYEDGKKCTVRRQVIRVVLGGWCYVCAQLGLAAWSVAEIEIQTYFNWYFYRIDSARLSPLLCRFLMCLDWGFYILLLLSIETFLKIYYISTCLIIRQKFRNLCHYVDTECTNAGDLQKIYRYHTELSILVSRFDSDFNLSVFLWYGCLLVNICVKIQSVISGIQDADFSAFGYVITDITYYSLTFLVLSLIADDVGYQASKLLSRAHRLSQAISDGDDYYRQQIRFLLAKLNTPRTELTGWNCFSINKGFILTVIGSVITYTIILLQVTPKAHPS